MESTSTRVARVVTSIIFFLTFNSKILFMIKINLSLSATSIELKFNRFLWNWGAFVFQLFKVFNKWVPPTSDSNFSWASITEDPGEVSACGTFVMCFTFLFLSGTYSLITMLGYYYFITHIDGSEPQPD